MFTRDLLSVWLLTASACAAPSAKALPIVDLDYAIHQASLDTTNELYEFHNIRYAEPPLDALRFRHPIAPVTTNRTINDGSYGFACRQGFPRAKVVEQSLPGEDVINARDRLMHSSRWNEDCLFLNVVVPKAVFEKKKCGTHGNKTTGAPVIVWIHGGGSSWGYKDEKEFTPSGLIARSKTAESDGIIFVAINYRLGLFGFLNSKGDDRVDANAGLLDQRLALEWVHEHIHLFGGDPDNVTVHGQSAGAASIMYHITSKEGAVFQNAILQSPTATPLHVADTWSDTLRTASNVTGRAIATGEDLAQLSEEELLQVNGLVTFNGPGLFYWGPSPDGGYVSDWPNNLLRDGKFDNQLSLMVGYTANESIANIPNIPIGIEIALSTLLQPITDAKVKAYILETLYPPADKTDLYATAYERVLLLSAEATGFNCNPVLLASVFENKTWNYRFDVPPGYHFQDLNHTFYDGNKQGPVSPAAAIAMQTYIGQFATTADPNRQGNGLPEWPQFGSEGNMMRFTPNGTALGLADDSEARCLFWDRLRRGDFANGAVDLI